MPENLTKVQNYRLNILQRRATVEAQLKTSVQANLEEAVAGIKLLEHSNELISSVCNKYFPPILIIKY